MNTAIALLGLVVVFAAAFALAAPSVSRRLFPRREPQAAGAAVVPPVRTPPAGGMAVPVQPRGEMTAPFAYDNGLITGPLEGDTS